MEQRDERCEARDMEADQSAAGRVKMRTRVDPEERAMRRNYWYFDFISPFSYLQSELLHTLPQGIQRISAK
jgi:hypothetical protein